MYDTYNTKVIFCGFDFGIKAISTINFRIIAA